MKNLLLLSVTSFMLFTTTALCQKLLINCETLEVSTDTSLSFKTGSLFQVVLNYCNSCNGDKYEVTISGEQYENTSGIDAFKKLNKAATITESADNCYLLSLQVPDADKSRINIIRNNSLGKKLEERSYVFRNRGGLKFDVSTGFFGTSIIDNSYVLKSDSNGQKTIIAEDNGNHRYGIGILAHLHCRTQKWLSGGISGGFEINNDTKIGFLTGVSLFFGYDRKFVLTGGLAASKVKRLSKLYSTGEVLPAELSVVPMVDVWRTGYFYSLTYNF